MRRLRLVSCMPVLAGCAAIPVTLLVLLGKRMVMPPPWVHVYGVGVTALVATVVAVGLTAMGARRGDTRTVIVGGGFALMAALLAVHGLTTPGMMIGPNGLIAVSGAATLIVGGAVLALSSLSRFNSPRMIPPAIALQSVLAAAIVGVSLVGALDPELVPRVPSARSSAALVLLALGLLVYGALAVRAANTFLLTRRAADLAVVFGLVLLAASLWGALVLSFTDLGWWLGHIFELMGIVFVGAPVAYDLRRARQSRPLVGDFSACELVAAEEAFLGARVRALTVKLAEKDAPVEQHTRRVASLAVELGEELGLSPSRLRALAIGGLLHDIGKLSVPNWILQKPSALEEAEFAVVKRHPQHGSDLLTELGGFDDSVKRLVLNHHERLDGRGYPNGLAADDLDLETRILTVCDVFDALVSARVYRPARPREQALAFLQDGAGSAFDPRCIAALMRVIGRAVDRSEASAAGTWLAAVAS